MWLLENFTSHLWLFFYFGGTVLVLRQCSLPSMVLRGQHVFMSLFVQQSLQTPKWSCYLGEASGSIKETSDYALQSLRLFLCCGEVSFSE